MQEFATTQNGRRFLNDVNRIAQSLERLAHVMSAQAVVMTEQDMNAIKVALDMKYAQEDADRLLALVRWAK